MKNSLKGYFPNPRKDNFTEKEFSPIEPEFSWELRCDFNDSIKNQFLSYH
ncbi:MAG: hypothetical protein AAF915_10965 [Cyanobacteria bacterium P01_D01_bin.50]